MKEDEYKYWVTESGDKILISDMTTSHLKILLDLLNRR